MAKALPDRGGSGRGTYPLPKLEGPAEPRDRREKSKHERCSCPQVRRQISVRDVLSTASGAQEDRAEVGATNRDRGESAWFEAHAAGDRGRQRAPSLRYAGRGHNEPHHGLNRHLRCTRLRLRRPDGRLPTASPTCPTPPCRGRPPPRGTSTWQGTAWATGGRGAA